MSDPFADLPRKYFGAILADPSPPSGFVTRCDKVAAFSNRYTRRANNPQGSESSQSARKMKLIRPMVSVVPFRTTPLPQKVRAPIYGTPSYVLWANEVRRRAGYRCEECGRSDTRLFADHIVELKDGGAAFDLANGKCLCGSCHSLKTAREKLLRRP